MQKFYFESVSKSGENITGYLFAENETKAREKLNQQEMAVVLLRPYQESLDDVSEDKFEFEAMNPEGKKFQGEIEASDLYEAYKKLRSEYRFEVFYLVSRNASLEEKELARKNGVDPIFIQQFNEELKLQKHTQESPSMTDQNLYETESTEKLSVILKEKQEQMKFLQEQIDETIQKVTDLIHRYETVLLPEKRRFIQSELDRLARLRQSNSIEHLKSIILDLFKVLGSDDIFIPLQGELIEKLEDTKKEFQTVSMSFQHAINKGLSNITIDIDTLKEGVDIILNQKQTFYTILFFLRTFLGGVFTASILFLLFNAVRWGIGINTEIVSFYFQSLLFWMIFVFSGLFGAFVWFAHDKMPRFNIRKNLLITGIFVVSSFLLFIEFPVLFFWVRF